MLKQSVLKQTIPAILGILLALGAIAVFQVLMGSPPTTEVVLLKVL